MKIAIVLPPGFRFCADEPNSIETVVRTLQNEADGRFETRIFCESGAARRDDLTVTEIDPGPKHLLYLPRMIQALKAFAPDYIEFHQNAVSARPIAAALKKVPNSLYRHNAVKPAKSRFDRWRQAWQFRPFGAFIFVSEAMRRDFDRDYGAFGRASFNVANAIDASQWPGDPDHKDKRIVFSGRAAPEKGLAPLCLGLAATLAAHPDWRATLLLNRFDTHREWTEQQLLALEPFAAQVDILKDQPLQAVKDAMRTAAIAVIPSLWQEPFGLTAIEAHAAGCAVVSSGTGGLREASGDYAVYLPEVSGGAISAALTALIAEPERRRDLARAGQDFVRRVHAPQARARELDNVRTEIVKARKAWSISRSN